MRENDRTRERRGDFGRDKGREARENSNDRETVESERIRWKGNRRKRKKGCTWKRENFRQKEGDIELEVEVDSKMQKKKRWEQEGGKFAEKERDSEEVMQKIRRVGRSELENVRSRERKEKKEGERGRRRSECRRYRGIERD